MRSESNRPGEVVAELPAAFDAGLYFLGRILTPWKRREDCPKNSGESDEVCTIDVDPRYAAALLDVETVSHLIVLYFLNNATRARLVLAPRHYTRPHGVFALRAPARPNPIGLSVVRLVKVEGTRLSVVGLDCIDGTPLIDIKPYFASTDAVPGSVVGWYRTERESRSAETAHGASPTEADPCRKIRNSSDR